MSDSNIIDIASGKPKETSEDVISKGREDILKILEMVKKSVEDGEIDELIIHGCSLNKPPRFYSAGTIVNPFVMSYNLKYHLDEYNFLYCDTMFGHQVEEIDDE